MTDHPMKPEDCALIELPELPHPAVTFADHSYPAFNKRQMEDYARQAVTAREEGCRPADVRKIVYDHTEATVPTDHQGLPSPSGPAIVGHERLGALIQALLEGRCSPGEGGDLRPEVLSFAHLMEAQLRANDHKPGWKGEFASDLFPRISEEAEELRDAIEQHSKQLNWGDMALYLPEWTVKVGSEAADVANFAMMIADVCGALPDGGDAVHTGQLRDDQSSSPPPSGDLREAATPRFDCETIHDLIITRMFGPFDRISDELDSKIMEAALAIWDAIPIRDEAAKPEPVAWRWRHVAAVYGPDRATPGPWNDGQPPPYFPGEAWRFEIQGLYAAPPAPAELAEDVVRLVKALERLQIQTLALLRGTPAREAEEALAECVSALAPFASRLPTDPGPVELAFHPGPLVHLAETEEGR